MIRFWNEEKDKYLIEIYKNKSNEEIKTLFNKKFNTDVSSNSIGSRKNRLNIISKPKLRPKYTDEIREYIKANHKGKSSIELAKEVSKKFNIDVDNDSIQNIKSKIRINEGFIFEPARNDGFIKKGNIPINKGTKGMFNVGGNKTSFKKGNIPANYRPVGSERITVDGYVEIKIADPGKWISKARYVYEKSHGKILDGYNVMFADKNKLNFDIDNLILVSKSEDLIMNNKGLLFENKELTKSGHLIAKVIDKANKVKNERL